MKEEAIKSGGKNEKERPVLSTEDQEIKQPYLQDRRKGLRKKENRSEKENVEYTELEKKTCEKEAQTKVNNNNNN